jgi:hypothetical protein
VTDLVLLCHSGDKNAWVWPYWFYYWRKNFADNGRVDTVFLGESITPTEAPVSLKEEYCCGPDMTHMKTGKDVRWGIGLAKALQKLTCGHVLYFHEDYFIDRPCDFDKLISIVNWMIYNHSAMVKCCGGWAGDPDWQAPDAFSVTPFELAPACPAGIEPPPLWKPEPMYIYNNAHGYTVSHQATIWNREFLISTLLPDYSPWDHEILGSLELSKRNIPLHVYRGEPPVPYSETVNRGKKRPGSEYLFSYVDTHTGA